MISASLNMLYALKPFLCPSCNSPFSSKDIARHSIPRFPRLLSCGHSICENCLQNAVKCKTNLACNICKEVIHIDADCENPLSKFPPDLHALGILSATFKAGLPSVKVKMVSGRELIRSQSQESSKNLAIICGHCNQNHAMWQCDECQLNFCSVCYNEVHKDIKSKKHESKRIFAESYRSIVQNGCVAHDNRPMEFYCESDQVLTCSHCMLMGDHIGHEVTTLEEKNKSCALHIKNVMEDVTTIQKQLKYTEHLLSEAIPKDKIDITDKIQEVHNFFHKLHAVIQLRENVLIDALVKASQQNIEPIEELRLKITNYDREISAIKKDSEAVIENPMVAISGPDILKKLEETKCIPCHLISIPEDEDEEPCIKVDLKTDVENVLKKLGNVESNIKMKFNLCRRVDLPEGHCAEIPESFNVRLQNMMEAESVADSVSEDSVQIPVTQSRAVATRKNVDWSKRQPETVLVTHVENPTKFYVQNSNDAKKFNTLSTSIQRLHRSADPKKFKVSTVEIGSLYLVLFSVDKKWYRARVLSVLPEESTSVDQDAPKATLAENGKIVLQKQEPPVEVFYIDFGNKEIVPMSKIRTIDNQFLNLQGIAKECSLYDIKPLDKNEWTVAAINDFRLLVANRTLIMKIFKEITNVYHVDLCQIADTKISNDCVVSIRDALVFMEHGVFPGGETFTGKKNKNERKYLPPEELKANATVKVIVSHVENPDQVYIQLLSNYTPSLIADLQEIYNKHLNDTEHVIFAPRLGMMCAALYSSDNQWYRAQIVALTGGSNVEVQYVDFGNREIVHYTALRKLFDKFQKLSMQAIPCKLADIGCNQDICWSQESKLWITKYVSAKTFTALSLGMIPGENKAKIVLYTQEDGHEICVNALMVENSLAVSTGPFSQTARKKLQISPPQPPPVETAPQVCMPSPPRFPPVSAPSPCTIPAPVATQDPYAIFRAASPPLTALVAPAAQTENSLKTPQQASSTSTNQVSPRSSKYPGIAAPTVDSEGNDLSNMMDVYISSIESPGCFYIRITGENEDKLTRLMDALQRELKKNKDTNEEPEECGINKSYAVYSRKQEKWFRGKVLSKLSDKLKIQYVDYGDTEVVEKKNIRLLPSKFTKDETFAIRCHFDGVVPAGGTSKWSQSACDLFRELVAPHSVLILSSKGEDDKETNSLSADILYENFVKGGALEASKLEYVSVRSEIIKRGYALPTRRRQQKVSSEVKPPSTDSTAELQTILRNGLTYRQLLPAPTASPVIPVQVPQCVEVNRNPIVTAPIRPPTFQWKPCVPPLESNFTAMVTNITEDGTVQLAVWSRGCQLELIKNAMKLKYGKATEKSPEEPLPVGEACIAKFQVDSEWYRAEVISVYPDGNVKVNFVDYGNNEVVPLSDIRTKTIMQSFPRQCINCYLYGIDPNAAWERDMCNYLHSQIVETEVQVQVKGPKDSKGRLGVLITNSAGVDITELLLSIGFENAIEMSEIQPEVTLTPEIKSFASPFPLKEGEILPVCVTQVMVPNLVFFQILEVDKNKENGEAFLQLIKEMRETVDSFPKLENPVIGMPCCAKFSYDNDWYRCEITGVSESGVVVLYVDYGNSETVPVDDLRQIDEKFLQFPIQIHVCEIHGLKAESPEMESLLKDALMQKLCVPGIELFVKVTVSGQITKVDILKRSDDGEYVLAYQELIDDDLATLNKSEDC